ncbi:ABC transporter permease [Nesterenkonia sp. LB17]|uniref:ABC transporter permease n=1 Tax=unclassified Nesterenkonia TaxID=2629769 RepID=UPI001F4CF7CE|nr:MULTISPECIES: ABC transporter permease [unclassified Nesterenkonia]MCH8559965.1 ABC transporter permease [Nesterenkonia sp. DZ6]MCH8562145.1 ABC transporter permease [Nesterenkonia sp. YGD6]MCH8564325.1 ABC transporter permease [Nesterenkonia sp. LB17]MCH8569951.1 ABC transporter permease [Nesterenkonia sp. AY15]
MITAFELGLIYAIMALGVYLTFRILNFPDLTVDGSFTSGAATAAILITNEVDPFLATAAAFVVGSLAGMITGLLHTKGNINGLLAGILTMIGLYSINLRIMDGANVPLLGQDTVISMMRGFTGVGWTSVAVLAAVALIFKLIMDWYLQTDNGLALRATGDNEQMISSFAVSTDRQKIIGLMLSNGLVGIAGAVVAQHQGFADIGMGIGLILVGLASVIVGQAIFGSRSVIQATLAVILGAVVYRLAIQLALNVGLNPNDMKLMSAVLVVAALLLPQWKGFSKLSLRRKGPSPLADAAAPLTTSDAHLSKTSAEKGA